MEKRYRPDALDINAHEAQLRHYMTVIGVPRGVLVYMIAELCFDVDHSGIARTTAAQFAAY